VVGVKGTEKAEKREENWAREEKREKEGKEAISPLLGLLLAKSLTRHCRPALISWSQIRNNMFSISFCLLKLVLQLSHEVAFNFASAIRPTF